ncbi:hypothetical protein P8452_51258 [Trifolium repens]|nr:hypothetical protein P8452_51258 [Trifolium repens]
MIKKPLRFHLHPFRHREKASLSAAALASSLHNSWRVYSHFGSRCACLCSSLCAGYDNPANALLSFISESEVHILVLGSDDSNFITSLLHQTSMDGLLPLV